MLLISCLTVGRLGTTVDRLPSTMLAWTLVGAVLLSGVVIRPLGAIAARCGKFTYSIVRQGRCVPLLRDPSIVIPVPGVLLWLVTLVSSDMEISGMC